MKTHANRDSEELKIFKRPLARYENMPLDERKYSARESLIKSGTSNKDVTIKNVIIVR